MNEDQQKPGITNRQKLVAGGVIVFVVILIWQVIGLMGGSSSSSKPTADAKDANARPFNPISDQKPVAAKIPETPLTTAEQTQLAQNDKDTQERYVKILNELQLLKLAQQIMETNKSIAAAKTATIKSQKEIVDLLTPKAVPKPQDDYAMQGSNPAPNTGNAVLIAPNNVSLEQAVRPDGTLTPIDVNAQNSDNSQNQQQPPPKRVEVPPIPNYSIVSVSELMHQWAAVISFKGKLYSMHVGDIMPVDSSTVIDINRNSVTFARDGIQRKISLVPII